MSCLPALDITTKEASVNVTACCGGTPVAITGIEAENATDGKYAMHFDVMAVFADDDSLVSIGGGGCCPTFDTFAVAETPDTTPACDTELCITLCS